MGPRDGSKPPRHFCCCRAVYPHMKAQGGDASSTFRQVASGSEAPIGFALLHFEGWCYWPDAFAGQRTCDDNIGVNAITPGFTLSETQIATSSSNYVAGRDLNRCFKRPQVPMISWAPSGSSCRCQWLHDRTDAERKMAGRPITRRRAMVTDTKAIRFEPLSPVLGARVLGGRSD